MGWPEALATVALFALAIAIGGTIGAFIAWPFGNAAVGFLVGAFVSMPGWIAFGAYLNTIEAPETRTTETHTDTTP